MRPGEVFNPRFEACRFHPEEIVARWLDLTGGQKWLYDRMVGWARVSDGERPNERAGELWRSHNSMANELGKSSKQIGRDVAKLEAKGLIAHRKRDGRKSNTYVFLFHRNFEGTPMSTQEPGEVPEIENLNRHPRPVRTDLNGHPRPSNQKVFNQQEHALSEDTGRLKEASAANSATASATRIRGNQTSPASASAPRESWPMGGWENAEDFEGWWDQLVREHPNKNRNGVAKIKALELLVAGTLDCAEFEAGYAALRERAGDRWTEEHGRYVPNLWQLLDDRAWKHASDAGPPRLPVPDYQNANDYARRLQAE